MGKKLLIAVVAIVALGAVAFAVILANLNPIIERFKPRITKAISDAIQTPIEYGAIKAQIFPSVAIELSDVTLKGTNANERNSVKSLLLSTGLLELLRGQVTVNQLKIKDAQFSVTRAADGSLTVGGVNLSGAKDTTDSNPAEQKGRTTENESSNEQKESIAFAITEAELENAHLIWKDESVKPAQTVEVKDLSAQIKNLSDKEYGSLDIQASALGTQAKNIHISGKASLAKTKMGLPKADLTIALADLDLDKITQLLNAYQLPLDDIALGNSLSLKSEVHIGDDGLKIIPSLDATAASITYAKLFSKPKDQTFTLDAEVRPALLGPTEISRLDVKLGSTAISAPLSIDGQGDMKSTLTAPNVALGELNTFIPMAAPYKLGGAIAAKMEATVPKGGAPKASGTIELKDVSAAVPVGEASAGKALSVTKMNGTVDLQGTTAKIPSFTAEVAGQPLQLKASLSSFESPVVAFVLQSAKLDLPAILSQMGNTALDGKGETDFSGLEMKGSVATKPLKGDVHFAVTSGHVTGVPLGATNLQIAMANDQATLKPSTLALFGGTVKTEGSFDLSGAQAFSSITSASNLHLDDISKLVGNSKSQVQGLLNQADVNLRGSLKAMPDQLAGTIRVAAGDGSIQGFNLLGQTLGKVGNIPLLGAALTSLIPAKYQPLLEANSTPFQSFKADIVLGNQTATIQELSLVHPVYTLTGTGTYRFDGEADIRAQLRLTPNLTGEMELKEPKLKLLTEDGFLVIPVVIKLGNGIPIVLPDISELTKRAAANTAKETVGRALDKVAPGLGQGAGQLLNGLFK